jgi:general secretion pathway protein A
MGRGLVLQDLIQALPPRQHSAVTMTVEAGMQELAFAKNLLYELGVTDIHRKNLNIHHLLELLKESVLRQSAAKNVRLILCFEEAQTMTIKIFSLLQWLLNIEASRRKLVTILLVGDPSLHDKFQQKGMEFLKNRIYASVQLAPLTLTETENYLHDKLAMAHCTRKIFTPAAAQIIFSAAAGLHREINSLAHTALIRAFELRKKRIDQAVMRRCLADAA